MAILLICLSLLILSCQSVGTKTICELEPKKDTPEKSFGNCSRGGGKPFQQSIFDMQGWCAMPQDDCKAYINECEQAKKELESCQRKGD